MTDSEDQALSSRNGVASDRDQPDADMVMSGLDRFEGTTAIVTGGGSGIGRQIALALDRAGAKVTIIGRREEPLIEVSASFRSGGSWLSGDLTDPDQAYRLCDTVQDRAGAPSILVNNAGAVESAPFSRSDHAMLRRMLAVNLEVAFIMSRAVLDGMAALPWGRIINIASTAGLIGYPYVSAYVAAKHGLVGMTRALALELASGSITVNAICPGFTETPLLERSVAMIAEKTGATAEMARSTLTNHNPQGRMTDPDEIAATALFLCSRGARGITGQTLSVSGGEVM